VIITQTSCQFKGGTQKGGFVFEASEANIDFTTVKNDDILLHKHIEGARVIHIYGRNYNFKEVF